MSKKRNIPVKDESISDNKYYWLLGGLVVIGLFLRFTSLGFNSLWLDEATTAMISSQSFQQIWNITITGEFNPPLFYWMEHVMLMFGNNEFILRFLPALFGVATIIAVYFAGKEFIDKNVGIIAASAITFSPFLIIYSQEARSYSVMLFFVAAASVFYFKALKSNSYNDWILFGVLSSIALWCHFYAIVIVASYILYALMVHRNDIKKDIYYLKQIGSGFISFIVLSLPLIIIIAQLFGSRTSTGPVFGYIGIDMIIETFREISGFSDIVMYLFMMLFILGIFQAYLMDKDKSMFFVWMIVSIFAVSYILSFKMPMVPRYVNYLSIIFFIGIALSYKIFYKLVDNRNIVYCFMILFMVISVPFASSYYNTYSKDDWRYFSSVLSRSTNDGDYVVFVPAYIQTPVNYYYSNVTDRTIEYGAYNESELRRIQPNNNSIYYVVTPDIFAANPNGDAMEWLIHNTTVVWKYNNINLLRRN